MWMVVITLLLVSLGAAVSGALVTGLFWLTVIGFGGLFLMGAVALSMLRPLAEDDAAPAPPRSVPRPITSAASVRQRGLPQDGGELRRAA